MTSAPTEQARQIVSATHIDYDVVMSKRAATPVRFDPPVADRLASFVAANPGMSLSSAANRLVDEALRMAEHPGVIFRSGPTGRRAALAGGPDVWEVIRAIKSAHSAEPRLNSDDLISLVSDNTGIALRLVNTVVRYWAAYPSEVEGYLTTRSSHTRRPRDGHWSPPTSKTSSPWTAAIAPPASPTRAWSWYPRRPSRRTADFPPRSQLPSPRCSTARSRSSPARCYSSREARSNSHGHCPDAKACRYCQLIGLMLRLKAHHMDAR